jgi:hypothetical protein
VPLSVALTSATTPAITLASRESGSSLAPRLVVTSKRVGPAYSGTPFLFGTPQVGSTLMTGFGEWAGTKPIAYAYEWQRCDPAGAQCRPVLTTAGNTYLLTSADAGTTIRVVVTGFNAAGSSAATSRPTAVVSG